MTRLLVFRDGVSESQFNQVLNIELEQIIEVLDVHFTSSSFDNDALNFNNFDVFPGLQVSR